jgi:two-component system, NarL family, captular synthesis response regulator RcsB
MDSTIRIIVADDHAVVREGIRIWLERDPQVKVVATAVDTESLADRIDLFPCEVVISDIGMRGINGESNAIAFLRRFLKQIPRPRVIVVTMIAQPQMLAGLLEIGVDGLVDTDVKGYIPGPNNNDHAKYHQVGLQTDYSLSKRTDI